MLWGDKKICEPFSFIWIPAYIHKKKNICLLKKSQQYTNQ